MKSAVVEKRFDYKGFPCVVIMQLMAFRTGYVGIHKNSKYYGSNYDELPIDCHGSLTYSESHLYEQKDKDTWWIGFDTGHYGDGYDFDSAKELFADDKESLKQLEICEKLHCSFGYPASLDYCINQCKQIVDQILESEV